MESSPAGNASTTAEASAAPFGAAPASSPASLADRLLPILAVREPSRRRAALDDLAAALAAHDPASATAVLQRIMAAKGADSAEAYAFVSGFVGDYARANPLAAANWAEALPLALRFDAFALIAKEWSHADLPAVSSWANLIAEPSLRTATLRRISEAVETSGESKLLAAWAERLAAAPDATQHTETIARLWGKGDLNAAYDWSNGLTDATQQTRAVVAIAGALADEDPQAASGWVERFPAGAARTQAATVTAAKWAETNPEAAANWIKLLGDAELLEAAVHGVARRWLDRDRATATTWLQNAPVSEKTKQYLLGR